jgi:molybdopterin converting factor small subunit
LIRVRCLGHISRSIGSREILINESDVTVEDLFARLESLASSKGEAGFNKHNTLLVTSEGEAFRIAKSTRRLQDGDKVTLLPVSHGG